jgi:hypothetical protein
VKVEERKVIVVGVRAKAGISFVRKVRTRKMRARKVRARKVRARKVKFSSLPDAHDFS